MSATEIAERPVNAAAKFRQQVTHIAGSLLREWVGEDRANEAIGRIAAALSASAAAAKNPTDFYECTPQSVATCIAVSALTSIMPSVGSTALAYVQPQRPRKGEPPQLQYSLSHRGLNALAKRSGQMLIPMPIGHSDVIDVNTNGEVAIVSRDIDNPPMSLDELRGVVIVVKDIVNYEVIFRGWMPVKMIIPRRAMSRSWSGAGRQYSPWTNWPVEMAMKTAMHYAISRGWAVIDDTTSVRAMSMDAESDVIDTSAVAYIGSGSLSGVDALNAALNPTAASAETPTEAPAEPASTQWGDRLKACNTLDELQALRDEAIEAMSEEAWEDTKIDQWEAACNARFNKITA